MSFANDYMWCLIHGKKQILDLSRVTYQAGAYTSGFSSMSSWEYLGRNAGPSQGYPQRY